MAADRTKTILRTSFIGILTNLLLSTMKIVVGIFANSITVVLDAVNNLSDAISSVVTMVGAKLATKPADKKHPLGYGRIEFLSSMVVAAIVLAAGITSFIQSIEKIITPETQSYSTLSLVLISIAVVTKIVLGLYTRHKGKQTQSDALIASGSDALFDALVSLVTLISALISLFFNLNLDGFFGSLLSLVILKTGFSLLMDSVNQLLGKRADTNLSKMIKTDISKMENVLNAHDLFLDSYGPDRIVGWVHLAVSDRLTANQIDELSRKVTAEIYQKYQVYLTCGIYAVPVKDSPWYDMYCEIQNIVLKQEGVLEMHGFHVSEENSVVYFDVVRDFSIKDPYTWTENIKKRVTEHYPQYRFVVIADLDYSD